MMAWKGCWLTCLFTLGCVHSLLFSAFHMDFFLTVRSISVKEVAVAQSIYWIWNTANDVFSGWLADTLAARQGSRLPLLLLVHLLWPLASVLPFLPVPSELLSTGSFYLVCISFYDGCVSLAMIARNTFLTEITANERERIQMQRLNSLFGNLEFLVTLAGFFLWHRRNSPDWGLSPFVAYVVSVGAFSALISVVAVRQLTKYYNRQYGDQSDHADIEDRRAETEAQSLLPRGLEVSGTELLWGFWSQVRGHSNFWMLIGLNILTEGHRVLLGQFNLIFVAVLLYDAPESARDALMSAIPIAGGALTLLSTFVSERYGTYRIVMLCLGAKLVAGVGIVICFGGQVGVDGIGWRGGIGALMLIVCNACTQVPQAYGPILMANVIDENRSLMVKDGGESEHDAPERAPMQAQSMFWAMNALCVKPFNSVGPVVGMAMIGERYVEFQKGTGRGPDPVLWDQVVRLLAVSTVLCAACSLWAWRAYSLHGNRLRVLQGGSEAE